MDAWLGNYGGYFGLIYPAVLLLYFGLVLSRKQKGS
jgi:hypothetical protein